MSMSSNTTIYDIAKRLNITAATVSRALNNHPRISKKTKKLVLETAQAMNYEPNKLAVALKNGRSNNVGVIVPYINRNFFSSVIRGIEEELYPEGYNVIICQTHDREEREFEVIRNLLNSQVEGIIMSLARNHSSTDHFEEVLNRKVPLVFFDRKKDMKGVSSVSIDDYRGGYDATKHLIQQGRRRIAHLAVDFSLELYKNRYEGYRTALRKAGLEFEDDLLIHIKSSIEDGRDAAEKLMALKSPPDAIFSSSDYGALGAIQWLISNGYKVPEDIGIVGFSNEPFTQFMELSISSVDQKPIEMGKIAAKIFLEKVQNSANLKIQKDVILKPELLPRMSSLSK